MLFEPAPVWERVQVPVFAIWGAEDIHLPAARSRDIVEAALVRGKNADRTLVVLPELDHNFAVVRAPGAAWDFPRASAEYETVTVAWLRRLKDTPLHGTGSAATGSTGSVATGRRSGGSQPGRRWPRSAA